MNFSRRATGDGRRATGDGLPGPRGYRGGLGGKRSFIWMKPTLPLETVKAYSFFKNQFPGDAGGRLSCGSLRLAFQHLMSIANDDARQYHTKAGKALAEAVTHNPNIQQ